MKEAKRHELNDSRVRRKNRDGISGGEGFYFTRTENRELGHFSGEGSVSGCHGTFYSMSAIPYFLSTHTASVRKMVYNGEGGSFRSL